MNRSERYAERTCEIINNGGYIFLRSGNGHYVTGWSNFAGGPDKIDWSLHRGRAVEIADLETAFALRSMLRRPDVVVVVYYPRR